MDEAQAINPTQEAMYEGQNWMHIYPQGGHHSPLHIVGNGPAFRALAEALLAAADSGKGEASAITSDGEGYRIVVERTNTTGLGYTSLPYTAEWCRDLKTDPKE